MQKYAFFSQTLHYMRIYMHFKKLLDKNMQKHNKSVIRTRLKKNQHLHVISRPGYYRIQSKK